MSRVEKPQGFLSHVDDPPRRRIVMNAGYLWEVSKDLPNKWHGNEVFLARFDFPVARVFARAILRGIVAAAVLFIGALGMAEAATLGEIMHVKASKDFKRVIIKCNQKVEPPAAYELTDPSRLVIDFLNTGLGDIDSKTEFVGQPIREIRAAKLPRGARLVLDFGGNSVPEYQIRQIDNYFVVFLKEFAKERSPSMESEHVRLAPTWNENPFPLAPSSEHRASSPSSGSVELTGTGSSGLSITSARVVNGIIVLEVQTHIGRVRTYRVDIGIDFDQMGFHTAAVRPTKPSERLQASGMARAASGGENQRALDAYASPGPGAWTQRVDEETIPSMVSGLSAPRGSTW